jgi:hypothetical protein
LNVNEKILEISFSIASDVVDILSDLQTKDYVSENKVGWFNKNWRVLVKYAQTNLFLSKEYYDH